MHRLYTFHAVDPRRRLVDDVKRRASTEVVPASMLSQAFRAARANAEMYASAETSSDIHSEYTIYLYIISLYIYIYIDIFFSRSLSLSPLLFVSLVCSILSFLVSA